MRLWLTIVAALSAAVFSLQTLVSWPLAAQWEEDGAVQIAYYDRMTWLPQPTLGPRGWLFAYMAPVAAQTFLALVALWIVSRRRAVQSAPSDPRRLARLAFVWACVFAAISLPAANVLQQDSWLSVAWGRMIVRGADPFTTPFTPADAAGLPLDAVPITMTYGPLWALISAIAAVLSGGNGFVAWVILKLVIAACWVLCLVCVRALARPFGPRREAMALVILGWLPVGVHLTIGEAHNDVVMVSLLLVALVARGRWTGPLALSASAMAKYTSVVLFPVSAVYEWRTQPRRLLLRFLPGALLLAAGAVFILSGHRLGETIHMQSWKFLDPADLLRLVGVPDGIAVWTMRVVFGAIALVALILLWRSPSVPALFTAELSVMSLVLLTGLGHVWPWFFLWVLPLAALVPYRKLSVFVLTAACIAPFTALHWWRYYYDLTLVQIVSTVMYGAAVAAVIVWVLRRRSRLASLRARSARNRASDRAGGMPRPAASAGGTA